MRPRVVKFLTKLTLVLTLVPQIVFGANFFTPRIQNYGSYKPVNHLQQAELRPLFGHVPADVNNSTKLEPVEKHKVLKLSITLPLNNEEELDSRLIELTNPNSPHYRQFLSDADYVARYAPTIEQVEAAQSYLVANGLTAESVDANRLIIHVTGTVDSINTIFNTEIYYFVDQAGKQFYAPAYELQIEASLAIHSVHGLENRYHAHPNFKLLKTPIESTITGPRAIQGFTPAQIKKAYSLSSSLDGSGQTLALFELDGFTASDITAYERAFNLPNVPLETVLVDNATGVPGDGAAEVTLDIELMIALAPRVSKIIVYEGPNSEAGVLNTYNKIATDNLAKSISTSWGASESASTGSFISAENLIFKQMVAQGQSLYAASGDSGAYDDGIVLSVDDPASQPLVVAVGGTTLNTNANGSYSSETTWSAGNGPGNNGGGGGISSTWSIPTWQQGVISSASQGSTTMRNVPDVALDADPATGYAIYFDGLWNVYGGTSCAAPLWAALTALVNQDRARNGQGSVGFPNPTIYQLGQSAAYNSSLHDIRDHSTNGYYPAVAGFDLATGWGTFYGDNAISYLAGPSTPPATCSHANPTVLISPNSQQAQAGGTLVYTVSITNNDAAACGASSFSLAATVPSGFTDSFSQASLSLIPSQSASTSLTVTSGSNSAAGNYTVSVNGVNSGSPSFGGSASATYVVDNAQAPGLNLTITPQNGNFRHNSFTFAVFHITLSNGHDGLAHQQTNLSVHGPVSWTAKPRTEADGSYKYKIFLGPGLPIGQYQMTVTSEYQGTTVSGQTTFRVH